jgi:hypothetical protein
MAAQPVRLYRITESLIDACARIDDIDAAFKIMQDAAGIDDGGLADMAFDRDDWINKDDPESRTRMIYKWLDLERQHHPELSAEEATATQKLIRETMTFEGFEEFHTGGGCTAWAKFFDGPQGDHMLLVTNELSMFGPLEEREWIVGEHLGGEPVKAHGGLCFAVAFEIARNWTPTAKPLTVSVASIFAGLRDLEERANKADQIDIRNKAGELADGVVDTIARAFIAEFQASHSAQQCTEVDARNAAEESENVCHSHDFCDANMVMDAAWLSLFGRSMCDHADQEAATALWNAAWDRAKEIGFSSKPAADQRPHKSPEA